MIALLASSRKPSDEAASEAESDDPVASAGFNPQRYVSDTPEMGRLYQAPKSALMLGRCERSITYNVLLGAAQLAGVEDPHAFACDTARRVTYAGLILAAEPNAPHLTADLRRNDFRNAQGLGVDLRRRPLLWMPILDLDMLAHGVIQVAHYEEDGTPGTALPPEIREVLA